MSSVPELGKSPGEGNGNPLQYSSLENSMDREAQWTTVQGVTTESEQLNTHALLLLCFMIAILKQMEDILFWRMRCLDRQ